MLRKCAFGSKFEHSISVNWCYDFKKIIFRIRSRISGIVCTSEEEWKLWYCHNIMYILTDRYSGSRSEQHITENWIIIIFVHTCTILKIIYNISETLAVYICALYIYACDMREQCFCNTSMMSVWLLADTFILEHLI